MQGLLYYQQQEPKPDEFMPFVTTGMVVAGAITASGFDRQNGNVTISGATLIGLASASVVVDGQSDVYVFGYARLTQAGVSDTALFSLLSSGASFCAGALYMEATDSIAFLSIVDIDPLPPAGLRTYALEASMLGAGSFTASYRRLIILVRKR